MKKIIYILPFMMFSCGNSSEEQLKNLRDSLTICKTEGELEQLKDSIRQVSPSQEEKKLMEERAQYIADSIAKVIGASLK